MKSWTRPRRPHTIRKRLVRPTLAAPPQVGFPHICISCVPYSPTGTGRPRARSYKRHESTGARRNTTNDAALPLARGPRLTYGWEGIYWKGWGLTCHQYGMRQTVTTWTNDPIPHPCLRVLPTTANATSQPPRRPRVRPPKGFSVALPARISWRTGRQGLPEETGGPQPASKIKENVRWQRCQRCRAPSTPRPRTHARSLPARGPRAVMSLCLCVWPLAALPDGPVAPLAKLAKPGLALATIRSMLRDRHDVTGGGSSSYYQ